MRLLELLEGLNDEIAYLEKLSKGHKAIYYLDQVKQHIESAEIAATGLSNWMRAEQENKKE